MKLQFDYYPVMRYTYGANILKTSGELSDKITLKWNDIILHDKIDLEKNIRNISEIKLQNKNTLLLENKQSWVNDKFIELILQINLNNKKDDLWVCDFKYNLTLCNEQSLNFFNEKFDVGKEHFHFKLNGEILLHNQTVEAGNTYNVKKEFVWQGKNPIVFELEEYGNAGEIDQRFIQIVRFTIL